MTDNKIQYYLKMAQNADKIGDFLQADKLDMMIKTSAASSFTDDVAKRVLKAISKRNLNYVEDDIKALISAFKQYKDKYPRKDVKNFYEDLLDDTKARLNDVEGYTYKVSDTVRNMDYVLILREIAYEIESQMKAQQVSDKTKEIFQKVKKKVQQIPGQVSDTKQKIEKATTPKPISQFKGKGISENDFNIAVNKLASQYQGETLMSELKKAKLNGVPLLSGINIVREYNGVNKRLSKAYDAALKKVGDANKTGEIKAEMNRRLSNVYDKALVGAFDPTTRMVPAVVFARDWQKADINVDKKTLAKIISLGAALYGGYQLLDTVYNAPPPTDTNNGLYESLWNAMKPTHTFSDIDSVLKSFGRTDPQTITGFKAWMQRTGKNEAARNPNTSFRDLGLK